MSTTSTALLNDFPKLAELPENDIKDVLSDDRLCNAVLFTVPAVTAAMDEQEKLSQDNEELASESSLASSTGEVVLGMSADAMP